MEIPKIKQLRNIDPRQADTFSFMAEDGQEYGLYRPRLAFQLPRSKQGAVVIISEEYQFRKPKQLYLLYEFTTGDTGLLLDKVKELQYILEIREIYARLIPAEINMLQFANQASWQKKRKEISVLTPYPCDDAGIIDYHLTILRGLTRPENTRLIFRAGSSLETELAALPANPYNTKDDDYPLIAALCYGIVSLISSETVDQPDDYSDRAKTDWDPFDDKYM